jgi:hypothetical protein
MTLEELRARIEAAAATIQAAEESPIKGWGLNAPPPGDDWFAGAEAGPVSGCTSERCGHVSHDPAAPWAAWVPQRGVIVTPLGSDGRAEYFLAVRGEEVRFIRLASSQAYWARAQYVSSVPDYLLARLGRGR